MKALYPSEIYKYEWRVNLFLEKYKNEIPFEMVDGSFKSFIFNEVIYDNIANKETKNIRFSDIEGITYSFKHIAKNKEFGGGSNGLDIENSQLIRLSNQLRDVGEFSLKLNNTSYKVVDCISTKGFPKSDFHLIDKNGEAVVWISHKAGSRPQDFQQWGGISKREPNINQHEETQKFIYDVKNMFDNFMPNKTSIFRKIKDTKLKHMAVYGNNYGYEFNSQNVNVVLQGDIKIDDSGKFLANNIHENGHKVTGGFEPVLTAVYKGDRSDFGVTGARFGIMPIKSRKMTHEI